jgi:hypothetical protein
MSSLLKTPEGIRLLVLRLVAAVILACLFPGAVACGADQTPPAGAAGEGGAPSGRDRSLAPGLPVRMVDPRDTDQAIRAGDPVHVVVDAVEPVADRLLVFLPGTSLPPASCQQILKNAAAGGYDVVGLSYVNNEAVNALCGGGPPTCPEEVRREIVTGTDTSSLISVDPPNSIESRLVALLRHEGWSKYLDGDALRYALIAFAGHSQGGGHAALLGKMHQVHRVVLLAATEAAPWTAAMGLTEPDRHYAFMHTADGLNGFFIGSWDTLGIPGPLTNIDGMSPPYGGTHRLETSVPPQDNNGHLAVVVDPFIPMDGDQPLYRDVWAYLIGP